MKPLDLYELIQPFVKKEIEDYDENSDVEKQYDVNPIPVHVHNSIDAPPVSYSDLVDRREYISHVLFGTQAATAGNYSVFFTAPAPMLVMAINEVHTTAGTDGSAVTLQIEKLTGTTAPASGTVLLTTGFNLKGTANTVQYGAMVTSSNAAIQQTTTYLGRGDRLALKLSGTPTSVANMLVTVSLQPLT